MNQVNFLNSLSLNVSALDSLFTTCLERSQSEERNKASVYGEVVKKLTPSHLLDDIQLETTYRATLAGDLIHKAFVYLDEQSKKCPQKRAAIEEAIALVKVYAP